VTRKLKTAKTDLRRALLLMGASLAAASFCLAHLHAQTLPPGADASDFSSVQYFDAPNQQQVKSEISGAEAEPIEGGLLLIKQAKLERYEVNGQAQFIVTAPECVYNPMNGEAHSPGEVHMRTGDDGLRIEGQGFLWRQSESYLIISNHVQTIIEKAPAIAP
jgi:hypothetical protein